jgi:hypothetical protein
MVDAVAPVLVGAVAFGLARSVLLPGQGFWDTGEWQAVPPVLGTGHPTGYPTYVILGWLASVLLAPFGEPALRMNLLSALLLGAAAGLLVVLVRQLTGRTSVAVGAGLLLALTPLPWRMGAFADPHTLHLALTAALLVILVGWERRRRAGAPRADRWLVGAAVVYGVMLGNHSLTLLLAPGIGLFVLAVEPRIVRRVRFLGLCALALVGTTVALHLELPIRAAMGAPLVYGTPNTWDGFWYVVLAEQFRGDLHNPFSDLVRKVSDLAALGSAQLGMLLPVVPAALLVVAIRRPRFALLTGTWLLVGCWFAVSYTNGAIERYYLVPAFIVISWLGVAAGLLVGALVPAPANASPQDAAGAVGETGAAAGDGGAAAASDDPRAVGADLAVTGTRRGNRRSWLVAGLVGAVLAACLVVPAALAGPATRSRIDQSHDTRARDWSQWVLSTVERDALVVSWWSYSTPLWYRTVVLGERPDVTILDDRDRLDEDRGSIDDVLRANVGRRPVYLVRYPSEIADLETRWELERINDPIGQQPIYRVVGPRSSGRAAGSSAAVQAAVARIGG